MGGSLPFSELGPSLDEVLRQYLPTLAMELTLIIGPQLAVILRIGGQAIGEKSGKFFHRLALGGILCGLIFTLFQLAATTNGFRVERNTMQFFLIAAIVLYLVGSTLLMWATYQSKNPSNDHRNLLKLTALFFPILFVPVVIYLALPTSTCFDLERWLIQVAEFAWMVYSVLVVKDN